jgi:hypothetical protein
VPASWRKPLTDWRNQRESELRQSAIRFQQTIAGLNAEQPPSRKLLEVTARRAIKEAAVLEELTGHPVAELEQQARAGLLHLAFRWAALAARCGLAIRAVYDEPWNERI